MAEKAKGNDPYLAHRIVSSKIILVCAVLGAIAALIILYALRNSSSIRQPKTTYFTPSSSPSPVLSFAPTPTLAPGQKAIYTFYIQATSHKTSSEILTLNPSDTGRVFTFDTGTLLILHFGTGNFHITHSSSQDIFGSTGSKYAPIHLPLNSIGAFSVLHSGFGTITVIETE